MHMISQWKKIIIFSVKLILFFHSRHSLFCTFENHITPAMQWVCCKAVNLKFFGLWGHLSFSEQQSIAMILKTVRRYKDSKFRSRTWNANYEAKICVLCTHKWAKSGKISAIHNYMMWQNYMFFLHFQNIAVESVAIYAPLNSFISYDFDPLCAGERSTKNVHDWKSYNY